MPHRDYLLLIAVHMLRNCCSCAGTLLLYEQCLHAAHLNLQRGSTNCVCTCADPDEGCHHWKEDFLHSTGAYNLVRCSCSPRRSFRSVSHASTQSLMKIVLLRQFPWGTGVPRSRHQEGFYCSSPMLAAKLSRATILRVYPHYWRM